MTYETYRILYLGGALLAGIMLVVTIVLLFALKIPRVIGDLTGANAKKAIRQIRFQNERSGVKTYQSSTVNAGRGKITDKITPSGRTLPRTEENGGAMRTEKIETEVLTQMAQTVWQYTASEGTAVLPSPTEETSVLYGGTYGNETTVLSQTGIPPYEATRQARQENKQLFEVEFEITFLHSDVRIP